MKHVAAITSILLIGHLYKGSPPFNRAMANFINPPSSVSSAVSVPSEFADVRMLLLGVHTFLKQFHNQVYDLYCAEQMFQLNLKI